MTQVGDMIKQFDDVFEEWFESPLVVRNFVDGDKDEQGDPAKELHPDSPIGTHGQIESTQESVQDSDSYGRSSTVDADIYVPEDVLVTAGDDSESLPFATEIEAEDGRVYRVAHVIPEGNGTQRCEATQIEESDLGGTP